MIAVAIAGAPSLSLAQDFAIIGVACTVGLDAEGRCTTARIGLCNAGETPILAAAASESLVGRRIGKPEIDEAADLVQRAIDPGGRRPCPARNFSDTSRAC